MSESSPGGKLSGERTARRGHPSIVFACLIWLVSALIAISPHRAAFAQSPSETQVNVNVDWKKFRDAIPGHIQEWIVSGNGPQFTLIYSEPPPAFTEDEYRSIFARVFHGLRSVQLATRRLGYNGSVSDFVLHLDYAEAGLRAPDALNGDIATLSQQIYGTRIGARAVDLAQLVAHPPANVAPKPVSVNADQFNKWLLSDAIPLKFVSPETGFVDVLSGLLGARKAGRYISSDNSLVVLVFDFQRPLNFDDIRNTRLFALDSDFILGGVVKDDASVAIVARARQSAWIDFPPLRVEDVLNLATTKDAHLAQSYDRSFLGAGKVVGARNNGEDWAPSFLSADLVDTEFGSLLNQADAILKSQSLSNAVAYEGYGVKAIPNPPYLEGVFAHLKASSLIFNFNTVGSGHWLEGKGASLFAANRLGSFSVTYLPSANGQTSTEAGTEKVAQAERAYTDWFDNARNKTLARTVQYMTIYQLFQSRPLTGIAPYTDRQEAFVAIGSTLKGAAARQFQNCLDHLPDGEGGFLPLFQTFYRERAEQAGMNPASVEAPTSLPALVARAAKAANAARYDGNLNNETSERLAQEYDAYVTQHNILVAQLKDDAKHYELLKNDFKQKYDGYLCRPSFSKYHTNLALCEQSDETFNKTNDDPNISYYNVPSYKSTQFESDKYVRATLENRLSSQFDALKKIKSDMAAIQAKLDALILPGQGDQLTLEILTDACAELRTEFTDEVLRDFETGLASGARPHANLFALHTPTIVMSRNGGKGGFVGGHNAERIRYGVEIDAGLAKGQFVSTENGIKISPADVGHLDRIAASMARVSGADAKTQASTFSAASVGDARANPDRLAALGIPRGDIRVSGVETTSVAYEASGGAAVQDDAIRIGRSTADGRLYLVQATAAQTLRTTIYDRYALPEIIASRSVGRPAMQIRLDASLSPRDVEAIIGNYVSAGARTEAGGGGGGWRIIPSDLKMKGPEPEPSGGGGAGKYGHGKPPGPPAPGPGGRRPLLVTFIDENSGARRAIVETEKGSIEVEAMGSIELDAVVKQMSVELDNGARLSLEAEASTKVYQNGAQSRFIVTGFKIEQPNPISGKFVTHGKGGGAFDRGLVGRLRDFMKSTFDKLVAQKAEARPRLVDYLVELKQSSAGLFPGYEVSGRIDVAHGGARFVLEFRPRPQAHGDRAG